MAEISKKKVVLTEKEYEVLKRKHEQYKRLFECAFDVIFSFDKNFRIISVSPSVERVLGYKPEELIGRFFPEMEILSPEYLELAFSEISRLFAGDSIEPTIYEFIAKDGKKKIGEVAGAPLIQENKIVGVISVARDITEQKEYQVKLEKESSRLETEIRRRSILQNKIEASECSVNAGLLSASIVHDIKSPLTAILSDIHFVKEKTEGILDLSTHISSIEKGCKDITNTINKLSLLTCSNHEEVKRINLNEIIKETIDMMQSYLKIKGISIEFEESLKHGYVCIAADRLRHVLMNLIRNSCESFNHQLSDNSSKEISIKTFLKPSKYIIEIADTGPGIPGKILPHIFNPFYTYKKKYGSGLGLYMCRNIINQYKGKIYAKNKTNENGAIFTVELLR